MKPEPSVYVSSNRNLHLRVWHTNRQCIYLLKSVGVRIMTLTFAMAGRMRACRRCHLKPQPAHVPRPGGTRWRAWQPTAVEQLRTLRIRIFGPNWERAQS